MIMREQKHDLGSTLDKIRFQKYRLLKKSTANLYL